MDGLVDRLRNHDGVLLPRASADRTRRRALGVLPSPGFAGEGPGVRVGGCSNSQQSPSPLTPLPQSRERGTEPLASAGTNPPPLPAKSETGIGSPIESTAPALPAGSSESTPSLSARKMSRF